MTSQAADHRRATAERNVAAILDAAEELLSQAGPASIAAVAARAGVSRVTVYAHFPTWEALLEAVVEQAVGHTTAVLASADLEAGPPMAALRRAGRLEAGDAQRVLVVTVTDLFAGGYR
jgi:AcrR family transcriptional regulator